jgi:hypothetical protein
LRMLDDDVHTVVVRGRVLGGRSVVTYGGSSSLKKLERLFCK